MKWSLAMVVAVLLGCPGAGGNGRLAFRGEVVTSPGAGNEWLLQGDDGAMYRPVALAPVFQLDRLRVHGTIATRAQDADAIQAVDVLELLPETSGDITPACTELAWAYASAIRAGRPCDPGTAGACMRSGALMQYVQLASGEILFEGLCTTCPAGVNAAEAARAAAALEDYRRGGCDRLLPCWCPTWRLEPAWTPQCLPEGECQ